MRGQQQQTSIEQKLADAAAKCLAAVRAPKYVELASHLSGAPADSLGYFELLRRYPADSGAAACIENMKNAIRAKYPEGKAPSVEHFITLHALQVAASRIGGMALAPSIKRQFAQLCVNCASPRPAWERNFGKARLPLMGPMAKLATLAWFPAGELTFDFHACLSRTSILKFPPRAVPGFIREIVFGVKGTGPIITPHINRWRDNPLIFSKGEVDRSLWRIAKTLEYRRDVKCMAGASWFYSAEVGKVTPHLAWMRDGVVEAGAYLIDMEPASEYAGFMEGDSRRRELYLAGEFCPRNTLVLWRRDFLLEWAAGRADLIDEGEEPVTPPTFPTARRATIRLPSPARAARHNGPFLLWDGLRLLQANSKAYIACVLLAPALTAALISALTFAWWAAILLFAVTFVAAWVFQYYFFQ